MVITFEISNYSYLSMEEVIEIMIAAWNKLELFHAIIELINY